MGSGSTYIGLMRPNWTAGGENHFAGALDLHDRLSTATLLA